MQNSKVLKTEITELDERLGGGIPSNSIVLLSFQTGTTFLEFTEWNIYKQLEAPHIVLVSFTLPALEFVDRANVRSVVDSEDAKSREEEFFTVIDCFTQESETIKKIDYGSIYQVSYPFDTDKLYSTIKKVREGLEKRKVVWVFNSLTGLSIGVSEEDLAKFCRRVFRLHKNHKDLAFYLLNMEAHSTKFFAIITQLVDIAINFKVEEKEDRLRNYLQVIKGVFPIDTKKLYYETNRDGKAIFY